MVQLRDPRPEDTVEFEELVEDYVRVDLADEQYERQYANLVERIEQLDPLDAALMRFTHARTPLFTRSEIAARLGIARSTLYKRIARIEGELRELRSGRPVRYCACGCGEPLPKATTRRQYLNAVHQSRQAMRRRRAAH